MATPANKIEVRLSADQRAALERLIGTGTQSAHARRRAAILLRADADGPDGWTDEEIAAALGINRNTVWRVRAQFAAEGLDATPHKRKAAGRPYRELDGHPEAELVALACTTPPEGHARWTMTLLAGKWVELQVVESIDPATVWRALKKTPSSRGSGSSGSSRRRRVRRS